MRIYFVDGFNLLVTVYYCLVSRAVPMGKGVNSLTWIGLAKIIFSLALLIPDFRGMN